MARAHFERVIYGMEPVAVVEVAPPVITPGCRPGRHCAAHGSGPFSCCRCGAQFRYATEREGSEIRRIK